jgi:hypothetical protein
MSKNIISKRVSIPAKAWEYSWQWLLNTRWGWIAAIIGGGVVSGIFVGNLLWERALAGLVGAIVAIVLIIGIAFIVHLIIAPSRLRKENRHKFIENNAGYISKIIGNPQKKKYLKVLSILESIIKIENEITDNTAGKRKLTNNELQQLRKKLNQQTNIHTLPVSEAKKIYLTGGVTNKINQTISKLGLEIIGNKPSENQIEFLLKTRDLLDDFGIGLFSGLEHSEEYEELLKSFSEEIPDISDEGTPDWILYLVALPSSINGMYIFWNCLPPEYQKLFPQASYDLSDYQSKRQTSIDQLINYAREEIEKM